jgi:uncharacterized protein YmfQ (DUF2313 family)
LALTSEQYLRQLQALLPTGAAWPREDAATLTKVLHSLADELARIDLRADDLLDEADVRTAGELLSDWERVLGLPDGCTLDQELSTADRQRIASQRLVEQGGQSRAYFLGIAEQLGEPGCTITEFRQATCNSNCNDALYSQADEFVWRLNIPRESDTPRQATCNDNCNVALQIYKPNLIECPISKRKPAHTKVLFGYDNPILDLIFTNEVMDPRITFSGGVGGTRVNSAGLIVPAVCPRFDYDPVTLACKGLLIEETRTNQIRDSANLDSATWVKTTGCTVTPNTHIAPDGTLSADTVSYDGSGAAGSYRILAGGSISSDGVAATSSIFLRADVPVTVRVYGNAVAGNYVICNLTPVWTRVPTTGMGNGVSSNQLLIYSAAGDNAPWAIQAWGGQLESGAFATSYIPTAGAAVTRTRDNAVLSGLNFSDWYNHQAGTIYVESSLIALQSGTGNQAALELGSTAGYNDGYTIFPKQGATSRAAGSNVAGVTKFFAAKVGAAVAGVTIKQALAYAAGSIAFADAGAIIPPTSNDLTLVAATALTIGSYGGGTGSLLNGHVKRVGYYKQRLSNERLQALTA